MKQTINRILLTFSFLAILLLLSSCHTRIMKTSPFYTGKVIAGKTSSGQVVRWDDPKAIKVEEIFAHDIKAKLDDDRIYVWPIFYKNFLMYSMMWPIAEINDVGWEIRPLVSVDNYAQDYRILTGGWNSKKDSNYILPLYVKTKNRFLSLPYSSKKDGNHRVDNYFMFAGYFTEDNSSYCFPLYYYDGAKSQLYTPLFSFTENNGYIFPIYFYDIEHNQDGSFKKTQRLLPPFGKFVYEKGQSDTVWHQAGFFPLFNYARKKVYDYQLNPKYKGQMFSYRKRPKDYWLRYESIKKSLFILPTIFFSDNEIKKQHKQVVFPFYFAGSDHYKNNDNKWCNVFPLYFSGKNGTNSEWITFIPFYFYKKDKSKITNNYFVLAGNKKEKVKGKMYDSSYFLPFYRYDYKPVNITQRNPEYYGKMFPTGKRPDDFYLSENTVSKINYYFPTIFSETYENGNFNNQVGFPFYFSGFDKRFGNDKEWWNIFPIYYSTRDKDTKKAAAFPFYIYKETPEEMQKNYLLIAGTNRKLIDGKPYTGNFIIPFFVHGYDKIDEYSLNPKYRGKYFPLKKQPVDYYLHNKTVAEKQFYFPSIFSEKHQNGKYEENVAFPFYFSGFDKRFGRDKDQWTLMPFYGYDRNGRNIQQSYLVVAGNGKKHINGKAYSTSFIFPFYNHDYEEIIHQKVNPKYRNKLISHHERPADYYVADKTVAEKNFYFPSIFTKTYANGEYRKQVGFPFYFSGFDKRFGRDKEWYNIFPFYFYDRNKKTLSKNYCGLAGSKTKMLHGKEYTSSYLLPFYTNSYQAIYGGSVEQNAYIFPNYLAKENPELKEAQFSILPFLFHKKNKERAKTEVPLGLYQHEKSFINDDLKTRLLGIGYYYNRDSNSESQFIFPNYYTYNNRMEHFPHKISSFLPFYWAEDREKIGKEPSPEKPINHQKRFYFPSIVTENMDNGDLASTSIFPLYFSGHDKRCNRDREWNSILPFYSYERCNEDISSNYLGLAGTNRKIIAEKEYKSSYFLPFYYYNYYPEYNKQSKQDSVRKNTYVFPNLYFSENKEKKHSKSAIFPFFSTEKTEEYLKMGTPFSVFQHEKSFLNDDERTQLFWYMYYFNRDDHSETQYIFPNYYSYENRKNGHTTSTFFPFTFYEKNDQIDSFGTFLWLYTSRHYLKKKQKKTQALWYLYYNKQFEGNKKQNIEPYETSRVLWKVYHRETKGNVTNIDLFPFLSYSENKKRTKFSFAYRFFSWEAAEKSTKVHLLFLPVWW